MDQFVITGGTPLYGSVRLGGAKNASFKIMTASLLAAGESRLLNLSNIADVDITKKILTSIGCKVYQAGERTLFIDSSSLNNNKIPDKFGPLSRASSMFIPVLLARKCKASVPLPGGDKIGTRPVNWHLEALQQMGARIISKNNRLEVSCDRLKSTTYRFPKNSHTGTETVIMAAVTAKGKTIIENAALEPEIDDLIEFLNNMGANIRRREGRVIEIQGVIKLHPTIHKIMPDRNEAVSYACAAIASKGDIIVENARKDDIEAFLEKLDEIGGGYELGNYGIRFFHKGPLRATDVVTKPHPGFMTDWQPLWAVLLTQAKGSSIIHEAVHSFRFHYLSDLSAMGANVRPIKITVDDPDKFYNFDSQHDADKFHAIRITGPTKLKGGNFKVPNLRAGATLALAATIAQGKTVIKDIEQIDRGYEDLDTRLLSLGAKIERISK